MHHANGNGSSGTGLATVRPQLFPPWQGHGNDPVFSEEFLKRVESTLINNVLTLRRELNQQLSDPRRSLERECGYPDIEAQVPKELYQQLYERDAVACRVVEVFPKECWQVSPQVYEDEDSEVVTPFEKAWDELGKTLRGQFSWFREEEGSPIWEVLRRADILSGIGTFGVILLGLNDGIPLNQLPRGWKEEGSEAMDSDNPDAEEGQKLADSTMVQVGKGGSGAAGTMGGQGYPDQEDQERPTRQRARDQPTSNAYRYEEATRRTAKKVRFNPYRLTINARQTSKNKLLYLRVFPETLVQITQWENNQTSPRYGQPLMYRITMHDQRLGHSGIGAPNATLNVHWSRIIHIADNLSSSEVLGYPRMRPVLNNVLGCHKLSLSDPEMYYKAAYPGLAFSTHPQLGGDVSVDRTALRNSVEEYFNGLQRYLLGIGMGINNLAPAVADPTPHLDKQIEMICIQLGVPIRVFKGSERGELASSQDDAAWNDRLRERQRNYITPRLIVPFVDRLIQLGVLPEPNTQPVDKSKAMLGKQGLVKNPTQPGLPGMEDDADVSSLLGGGASGDMPKPRAQPEAAEAKPRPGTVAFGEEEESGQWGSPQPSAGPTAQKPSAGMGPADRQAKESGSPGSTDLATPQERPAAQEEQAAQMGAGILGEEKEGPLGYCVSWPDLTSQTQTERATVAQGKATALSTFTQGGLAELMTPMDFLTKVMYYDEEEAKAILDNAERAMVERQAQELARQQQAIEAGLVPDPANPQDPVTLEKGQMLAPNPNNPGAPQQPIANPKAPPPGPGGGSPFGGGKPPLSKPSGGALTAKNKFGPAFNAQAWEQGDELAGGQPRQSVFNIAIHSHTTNNPPTQEPPKVEITNEIGNLPTPEVNVTVEPPQVNCHPYVMVKPPNVNVNNRVEVPEGPAPTVNVTVESAKPADTPQEIRQVGKRKIVVTRRDADGNLKEGFIEEAD